MEQGVHTPADFQKFNLRPGMGRSHFGNPAPRAAPPPTYYGSRHFNVGDLERLAREKGSGVMYTGSLLSVPSSPGVAPDLTMRSQQLPIEALTQMSSNIGVISQQGFNQNHLQYLQSQNSVRKNIVPYPGHPQDHSIPSSSTVANSRSTHPEHQIGYPNVRNALSALLHRMPESYTGSNLQPKGSRPNLYPQSSQARYPPHHRPNIIPPLSYKGMPINNNRPRLPPPPYKPPVSRPELPYNFYPFYHQQNKAVQEHFNSGLMSQGSRFQNPHTRIESQFNSSHIPVGISQPMSSQQHGNETPVTPTGIADNLVCKNLFDDNPPNIAINTSQTVTNIQENSDDKHQSPATTEQVQRPWFMEPSNQVDKDSESVDSLCNPIFGRWYKPPTDEDIPSSSNYEYVWDDSEIEEFSKEKMDLQTPSQPEAVKIHRPVQKSSKGKHNQASRLENQISRIYNSVHIDRVSPIDQVLNSDCVGREVTNIEEDGQMSGVQENTDLQSNSELTNQSFFHQNEQNQSEFFIRSQSDQKMSVEDSSLLSEKTMQNVVSEKPVEVDTLQSRNEQNCVETVTSCSENAVEIGNVDSLCSTTSIITQPLTYDKTSKKNERPLMRLKKSKMEKKIGGKSLRNFGSQKKVSPLKIKFSNKKGYKKSNSKTKEFTRERKKNQENVAHEPVKENKPHKRNLFECFTNVDSNKKVLRVEPFHCKTSLPSAVEKNSDTNANVGLKLAKDSGDGSEDGVSLSVNHSDLHGKDKLAASPVVHCADVNKTMTSLCENEDEIGGAMSVDNVVNVQKDKTILTEGTTNDHLHDVVSRIQNSKKRRRSAVMVIPQAMDNTESNLFSTSIPDGLLSPKRKKKCGRTVKKVPKLVECSVVLEDHFQTKRKLLTSGGNSKEIEKMSVLESETIPQKTSEGDIKLKETVEDNISQIEGPDRSANKCGQSPQDEGLSVDVSTSGEKSSCKVQTTRKSDVNIKVVDNGCDMVTKEKELEPSIQTTVEMHKERNEESKQKKTVAEKRERKEICNNTTVSQKTNLKKDKPDKDRKNASPVTIASESVQECGIEKGLNSSTHGSGTKDASPTTIASELDMECDLKNGLNSDAQDKDLKNVSPVIISSDSDMECDVENSMNVSTSFNESCDINGVNKSSFYVRFHGERILCLSNLNSKYFIMREFLRNCFQNTTQKTTQNQGKQNHSNQSYKHIYIAKERDLNIPYKELPESMRDQVKNYLVKENLLKPLQKVMHIGIIHVSDAKRLYHFFYGVKSCGDVNCISEWSTNWMPRKRSTDKSDLNSSREKSHHKNHSDKPAEEKTQFVEKDKTADSEGKKKRKKKYRGKGKKKKHTKKMSEDERHKLEEEATSRYLQEILKKKSQGKQATVASSKSDLETINCQVIHDKSSDDSDATIPYVDHDPEDIAAVEKNNSVGHEVEKEDVETREVPDNNVDYVIKGGIAELFGGFFRFLVVNDRKFYPFSDLCNHFDKDMIYSCIKDSPSKYKAVRCSPAERDFLNPLESTLPVLSENATIVEEELLYKVAKMDFEKMFDDDKEKKTNSDEKGKDGLESHMSTSFGSENTYALDTSNDILLYEIGSSPKADKKSTSSAEHHGDSEVSPYSNVTDINRNKIKLPNISSTSSINAVDMEPRDKSDEGKSKTTRVAVDNSPNKGQDSQHGKSCTERSTSPQIKSTGLCDETISKNQHSIAVACQGLLQQNASLKDRLIRMKKNTEDVSKGTRKFEQYEAEIESLINQVKKKNYKSYIQEQQTTKRQSKSNEEK